MDKLWAPWRNKYIKRVVSKKKKQPCVFCHEKEYIVFKTRYTFAILNIFPYNNGHLMVAPIKHKKDTSQLTNAELIDLFRSVDRVKGLLDNILKPHGYNIGINIERSAGQGVVGHLHIHIVPRWWGDNNFMSILNNTKVISQSLDELYKRLKHADTKGNKKVRK